MWDESPIRKFRDLESILNRDHETPQCLRLGCYCEVRKLSEQRIAARISVFIIISRFGTDERDYCRSKLATGKAQ
jgi:hypothetical protein